MTIRFRLTIYWTGIIALMLLAAGLAALVLFERQQWGALDSALIEEADTAAAAISRMGLNPASSAILRQLSEERDLGPHRRVRIVRDHQVLADLGDSTTDLPALDAGCRDPERPCVRDGARGQLRFAIVPLHLDEATAVLEDGVDATAIRKSIARLQASLLLILPLILAVAATGGYLLAGRALAPVAALSDELSRIDPGDLSRRLEPGAINDEIARLTCAINALLDRVEQAAETERRFVADAAHELRTPLTVLRTNLEVALGRERTAAEYGAALESSLREVIGLCAMADQLLTLARLGQEVALASERIDLGAMLREVVATVEPLAEAKHVAIALEAASEVAIEGNSVQLRRVVVNLVDNAIKFSPSNARIEIKLATRDGHMALRVADRGPGIPPADLPLIFDRFFRGHSRDEPGSGLGLSLCREIVRLHHGSIAAANRAGGGAEFVVALPLARPV